MPVPRNPGKFVRNRYGYEIYKHQEHWLTIGKCNFSRVNRESNTLKPFFLGKEDSWQVYNPKKFTKCKGATIQQRQACLNFYQIDGNIQFIHPIL